jgi:limonene-1,2-epoxide hydrolase
MGVREESIVRDFCNAWGQGVHDPDVDKIVSMFAPDGYWQLYMPSGPRIQGREALRTEILRQMSYVDKPECNIINILSSDTAVVTERRDYFTKNGVRALHHLLAIYELDREGLITAWREYFDTRDLAQQTRSDPSRLSGLET